MLDLVIRGGRVVTPSGVGDWDVGVQGERIAALGAPGTLDAGRVIDATGKVVVPGGIDPYTHLAHAIMSHPDEPGMTLGPEEDTRGMLFGGTTTHIDFAFVRPGGDIGSAIEQRSARWKGSAYTDYSFHVVLAGALELKVFEAIPEAIQAGFTSFKVFTTNILPPHPKRSGNRIDFGRIQHAMERIAPAGGIMTVHGEDEDIVQFNYEKHRAEGRMEGANLHLVHTKLSEQLAFRRTITLALKLRGKTIEDVTGGNLGAEARMGIAWTEGVVKRGMSLTRFVDITSANAARIFGLYPAKGALAVGSDADIVLIDPSLRKALARDDFHVSDYSPWEGWQIEGWPVTTLLRGRVMVENRRLVTDERAGRLVPRKIESAVLARPVC